MSETSLDKLTVAILHKNQAELLLNLIAKIPSDCAILVVDDYSDAKEYKKLSRTTRSFKLIKHHLHNDFAAQRNFALTQVNTSWTLFLDVDEQPTTIFWDEIKQTLDKPQSEAYRLHRRQLFLNHQVKFGEGGHQYPIRLAKTKLGQNKWQRAVHEVWLLPTAIAVGSISAVVWHQTTTDIKSFIQKLNYYTQIEVEVRTPPSRSGLLFQIFTYPVGKFIFNFILKLGFLDGFVGLLEAFFMSYHSLILRIKLYEKHYSH